MSMVADYDATAAGIEHEAALRLEGRPGERHDDDPPAPPAVDHEVALPPEGQHHETVLALLDLLGKAEARLAHHGDVLWQRTVDWHRTNRNPAPSSAEPDEGASDATIDERKGDAAASRYKDEVRSLATRIRSDLARLVQIDAIVIREQPKRLEGRDMLTAQVAAAGLCVSCWRWDQTNKDRERNQEGHFYDKEACRRCAGFKHEHGIYPPLSLLEAWHARGKNWTTAMVAGAVAKAKR